MDDNDLAYDTEVKYDSAREALEDQGWIYERGFPGGVCSFFSTTLFGMKFLMKLFDMDFSQSRRAKTKLGIEINGLGVCTENILSGFPRYFGSGCIEGQYYICMNYFYGQNVSKLDEIDDFDTNSLIPHFPKLAEDFGGLHEVGFIHRDIKPHNLLFALDGFKIIDLGLAVPFDGSGMVRGKVPGTPNYMSPEQAQGFWLKSTSDVYSLGMTLYELLAGEHPFVGAGSVRGLLNCQLNKMPEDLIDVNPGISTGLSGVVMRALSKRPKDRFRHGKEMADALAGCC